MSTAELATKIEKLSDTDYNMVVMLVERLSAGDESLKKLSADEIEAELIQSMKRSDMGFTKPAREVSKRMKEKYEV